MDDNVRLKIWQRPYLKNIVLILLVLLAFGCLSYVFIHNPHQDLQQGVWQTALKIRSYYRDQPGYWQLATNTAKEDGLIAQELLKYKEYDVQVGQGMNGENGLPSSLNFNITLKHLNKSACINLSEAKLNTDIQLILQKISIINEEREVEYFWGGDFALPIQKYATRDICAARENTLIWTFQ